MTRDTDSTNPRAGRGGDPLLLPIRRAALRAVELRSTRKVAAEIGISPAGLRYFLKSGVPYARTTRRLVAWYAEHGNRLGAADGSGDVILAAYWTMSPLGSMATRASALTGGEHTRFRVQPGRDTAARTGTGLPSPLERC